MASAVPLRSDTGSYLNTGDWRPCGIWSGSAIARSWDCVVAKSDTPFGTVSRALVYAALLAPGVLTLRGYKKFQPCPDHSGKRLGERIVCTAAAAIPACQPEGARVCFAGKAKKRRKGTSLGKYLPEAWCRRGDSNPHGFPHHPLKMACLPVPPLRHWEIKRAAPASVEELRAARNIIARKVPWTPSPAASFLPVSAPPLPAARSEWTSMCPAPP
jgi:hypothetical protein